MLLIELPLKIVCTFQLRNPYTNVKFGMFTILRINKKCFPCMLSQTHNVFLHSRLTFFFQSATQPMSHAYTIQYFTSPSNFPSCLQYNINMEIISWRRLCLIRFVLIIIHIVSSDKRKTEQRIKKVHKAICNHFFRLNLATRFWLCYASGSDSISIIKSLYSIDHLCSAECSLSNQLRNDWNIRISCKRSNICNLYGKRKNKRKNLLFDKWVFYWEFISVV